MASKKPKKQKLIANFKDFQWDAESLSLVNEGKAIILWDGVTIEDIDLSIFTGDLLSEMRYILQDEDLFKSIGNIELQKYLLKNLDYKGEEILWHKLVDDDRYISHEHYCHNSWEENFDIYIKMLNRQK